jgi:ubiquinone/menaquinone biosynthesis C-methylase UbiE
MPATNDQNARVLDQFSQQAEAYAALTSKGGGQTVDPMIEALGLSGGERLLDVGCGAGQFAVSAARLVREVVGVDLTPAMLAKARELQLQSGRQNIEWRQADSVSLPVADAAFDVVTSRAMFHHAADPKRTLAEMRRACAPGGRIAVLDLTPDPEKGVAFDCIEILRDPSHSRALTPAELRQLGAELGLEEALVRPQATSLPLEPVLAASFPPAGLLERVRELYARDAQSGRDDLGFKARVENGETWVTYPMTLIIWKRGS